MSTQTASGVLEDLEDEIQSEEDFEEIVKEYNILSVLADDSFYEVDVTNLFEHETQNVTDRYLLEFKIDEEFYGYIRVRLYSSFHNCEALDIVFESIEPDNGLGSIQLNLEEDFQSGRILSGGSDNVETNVLWPSQIELKDYKEISDETLEELVVKSELRAHYRDNKDENNFVKSRIESTYGSTYEDSIEVCVEWSSRELTWTLPRPKEDGNAAKFVSEYGGLSVLSSSTVYILPKSNVNSRFNSSHYFVDDSSTWALFSEDKYSKYIDEIENEETSRSSYSRTSTSSTSKRSSDNEYESKFYTGIGQTIGFGIAGYLSIQILSPPPGASESLLQAHKLLVFSFRALIMALVLWTVFCFCLWQIMDTE